MEETKQRVCKKSGQKNRAEEIANTFEWLITAFILAFVFRAFVMEAYRIPTGSMAETLMGAHFRLSCPECGYKYEHGYVPQDYQNPQDTVPGRPVSPVKTRCPSCGYYLPNDKSLPVSRGDRILVLKCIYQFSEPKQWDVIVFKDPLDPAINYIKRLVGRPEETLEIIDGDVYIDGKISRKPPKVQNELWMPVYDNDYQPANPEEPFFNHHKWRQPFSIADSKWRIDKTNKTRFLLDAPHDQINSLGYNTSVGNNFRATYAYGNVREHNHMPYCSDLMIRFYVKSAAQEGMIGIKLSKYQNVYKAWVDFSGKMVIAKIVNDNETILASKQLKTRNTSKPVLVKFANVDHQLIFQFGKEDLIFDLGRLPDDLGERKSKIQPQAGIFGSGKLALSHIAVFRDIHYTKVDGPGPGKATQGQPFKLEKNQYFVLGDNSPNSADSRWWNQRGRGNNGILYREGIVPREYLVGKAFFVYWPGGFKPFAKSRFAVIPDIVRKRLTVEKAPDH